jgi:hypothetical protein
MYALTILSFDSDLLKNDQKAIWLIEMHRILLQAAKSQFRGEEVPFEEKRALALYFENLKLLPEETKKLILGKMGLPTVRPSTASHAHQRISEELRNKLAEDKKDFIVIDKESGLETGILPIDITIKDGTGKRIISFIELDAPDHFITLEDGQRIPKRLYQLREELYKFNHPGIPLLRIDLLDKRPYEEYAEELYGKLMTKV